MPIQHRNISDPEIHEPKGVSTASGGTVYIANGSGSGYWGRVKPTTLQGVNSDSLADRIVMTDGDGGFKLGTQAGFGSIYSNGDFNNWIAGPVRNVTASGNTLTVTIPGHYQVIASATYNNTTEDLPDTSNMQLRLRINGSDIDARARIYGRGGTATISTVAYLGVGSTVTISTSNASGYSFLNGTISLSYVGP